MDFHTIKDIRRLNRIVVTLIRYGFGGLVARMRIVPFLGTIERIFVSKKRLEKYTVPERIRMVLEALGPTFVKLGQIASTRADILPEEWVEELKKLQDMVPPFPFEEVRKVVESSTGVPIENRFISFVTEPVASASIAQVHLAELRDGTKVAVKVKRPGIEKVIAADMSVMHTLAGLLERYVPQSRRYRPRETVSEFERVITNELDFTLEGSNAERFQRMFEKNPDVQIPRVFWDLTTRDILTLERISGTPIDEVDKIKEKGLDIKGIAVRGIKIFFEQVFEHGFFHADLHPGNIFVRDDGVIIYLDFGIVGRLDRSLRNYLASILFYLVRRDYYRMALVHRKMGLIGEEVSLYDFEETLRDITEPIYGQALEKIDISNLLMKLIRTARRYNMKLQPNLLLLQKSMVIIEGVGRQLYPDINMWEVARPLIYRWMLRERFGPRALFERGSRDAEALASAAATIPLEVEKLLDRALGENISIKIRHRDLDGPAREVRRAGRTVAAAVVAASLILAAAIVAVFARPGGSAVMGLPALSVAGFVLAALVCARLFLFEKGTGKDGRR